MPNLIDKIHILPSDKTDDPEDIFASAPGLIFTDDTRTLHGDPDSTIIYRSSQFGDIELTTSDPSSEDERQLFGHYLWNAGIKLAELISDQSELEWSVNGEEVLELGAGTGLGGIVAGLAGAKSVTMTDYPAPVIISNIQRNVEKAIPSNLASHYRIEDHIWGDIDSDFAVKAKGSFTRILAADCLWMPSQHFNIITSMLHFLTLDPSGRVFVLAGFHTGRAKLADFFDIAGRKGLQVEEIYEEDVEGVKREWMEERDGGVENVTERKRWVVIARLKRAKETEGLPKPRLRS